MGAAEKLDQAIASGALPVARVGRRKLVPLDALRRWLASTSAPASARKRREATAELEEHAHLSRREAAQVAGVSERTLDRAIASGALRATQIGRRRLVSRGALRRWLESGAST